MMTREAWLETNAQPMTRDHYKAVVARAKENRMPTVAALWDVTAIAYRTSEIVLPSWFGSDRVVFVIPDHHVTSEGDSEPFGDNLVVTESGRLVAGLAVFDPHR